MNGANDSEYVVWFLMIFGFLFFEEKLNLRINPP